MYQYGQNYKTFLILFDIDFLQYTQKLYISTTKFIQLWNIGNDMKYERTWMHSALHTNNDNNDMFPVES